ncbi:MAG: hypothetical protein M0006_04980 [Magnetospirillum sp.]|nr:hypothetical protein [Magnetospirillum sp.]
MLAGAFLSGTTGRLLPPLIPYRFFATAVVMHLAAWVVLLAGADSVPDFTGGLGSVLAALHLVTLGVVAMTALGAAFQLLPVATGRHLGPHWACHLTWWLYAPGVAILTAGMAFAWVPALHAGAVLAVAGLAVGGVVMAGTLARVTGMPAMTRHAWIALASLLALAVLGLLLVADFTTGFLANHAAVASAHALLAGYGFMGNLAMGFSYVLVPMFVLGRSAPDAAGKRTAALAAAALVLAAAGVLSGAGRLAALGALVGLAAAALHLDALARIVKTRMRKRLEPFFRLLLPAWVLLPASLLAGLVLALGLPAGRTAPLWGFLMVFGWLLSFVTGVLQRIMAFLASMHSVVEGGRPALLSALTAQRPLDFHAAAHMLALLLVGAGIVGGKTVLVRAGAVCGIAGAIAFAIFAVELARRYRAHRGASALPASSNR